MTPAAVRLSSSLDSLLQRPRPNDWSTTLVAHFAATLGHWSYNPALNPQLEAGITYKVAQANLDQSLASAILSNPRLRETILDTIRNRLAIAD